MYSRWYDGIYELEWLRLRTDRLLVIHANAFNTTALGYVQLLDISIGYGSVVIYDGAFNGLRSLRSLFITTPLLKLLPRGLFNSVALSLWSIRMNRWTSRVNLNEMFAHEAFRHVTKLRIQNVQAPQKKFRHLASKNFTAFRRLNELSLINCGIETISERTFDRIGYWLERINLEDNRIKAVNVETFRQVFETKCIVWFSLHSIREKLQCTCRMVEMDLLVSPFMLERTDKCIDRRQSIALCGVHRDVVVSKFAIDTSLRITLRLVNIHMAFAAEWLAIRTNFSSRIRMLFVDLGTLQHKKCAAQELEAKYKCLIISKSVDYLEWHEIDEVRDAEFISINAIPILYQFGARPMHSMTVRQEIVADDDDWIPIILII